MRMPSRRIVKFILAVLLTFALLASAATTTLAVLNVERQLAVIEASLDRAEYALEVMVRTLRQADPESVTVIRPPGCGPASCLRFTHPTQGVVEYRYCTSVTATCPATNTILAIVNNRSSSLTPASLLVRGLAFDVPDRDANTPPRVTVLISIGARPAAYATVNAQTTVAFRNFAK